MALALDCSETMAWVFSDRSSAATDSLRESLIDDSVFAQGKLAGRDRERAADGNPPIAHREE